MRDASEVDNSYPVTVIVRQTKRSAATSEIRQFVSCHRNFGVDARDADKRLHGEDTMTWTHHPGLPFNPGVDPMDCMDFAMNERGVRIRMRGSCSIDYAHIDFEYTDGALSFDFLVMVANEFERKRPAMKTADELYSLGPKCSVYISSVDLKQNHIDFSPDQGRRIAQDIESMLIETYHNFTPNAPPYPQSVVFDKYAKEALKL